MAAVFALLQLGKMSDRVGTGADSLQTHENSIIILFAFVRLSL